MIPAKFSHNAIQFVKIFLAVISGTTTVLYLGTGYIKTEIKSAMIEIVTYRITPLKEQVTENKVRIEKIDKEIPLITYRLTALEAISKYATLPNEVKRKKENE